MARALLLAAAAAAAAAAAPAAALNLTVSCGAPIAPLEHVWRSCGYSPAQAALRPDGVENTLRIGATPRRGIGQVRIHFLLDLLTVTGFYNDSGTVTGFRLLYDWAQLDFLLDTLVASRLSPGFELMGSPSGFPQLPQSFWAPWANNFKVQPNQTLGMWRQLVGDVVLHCAARFGVDEVAAWNWESWNEPDVGWGWPKPLSPGMPEFAAYGLHYDAGAAGIADAEAALGAGVALRFGGPASCCTPADSDVLAWVLAHAAAGRNAWTGAPARLDFLSIHFKGKGTSELVAAQALGAFTWMRTPGNVPDGPGRARLLNTPFFNDESDPLVGWLVPQPWRADARYAAIIPKIINQHLLQVADNGTAAGAPLNNPLGLLSNDNGFMTQDGSAGFEQRTLLARFADLPAGRFGFVRKPGLAVMALLSKLGDSRVDVAGAPGAAAVAGSPTGVIASVAAPSAAQPFAQVAVLVYNSNDTEDGGGGGAGAVGVAVSLADAPFAPGDELALVHWRIDDAVSATAYAVWTAAGSPALPSSELLLAMRAVDGLVPLAPPARFTMPPDGAGAPLVLPGGAFSLPLPGVSLLHVVGRAAGSGAPLAAPGGLRAYVKPPAASLLDAAAHTEVLVLWDCDGPRGGGGGGSGSGNSSDASAPSQATLGYEVQVSTAGPGGPWAVAQAGAAGDCTCAFAHAAGPAAGGPWPALALWYRVAALDYWGGLGGWAAPARAVAWPGGGV